MGSVPSHTQNAKVHKFPDAPVLICEAVEFDKGTERFEAKCKFGRVKIDKKGNVKIKEVKDPVPVRYLVLPGFVDGHSHVAGLAELAVEGGKKPNETSGCLKAMDILRNSAIRNGVIFLTDFADYPEGKNEEFSKVLKHIVSMGIGACLRIRIAEVPKRPWQHTSSMEIANLDSAEKHILYALGELRRVRDDSGLPLRLFIEMPNEFPERFQPHILDGFKKLVDRPKIDSAFKSGDLWLHAHSSEWRKRREVSTKIHGMSPIQVLHRFGLLRSWTILTHCIYASAEDIDLVRMCGARIQTCPKFANGKLAPVRSFLDARIPVGLCSDYYAVNPITRMQQAYQLHRSFAETEAQLDLAQILYMATTGAARVYDLDDQIGGVKDGRRANLVLLNLDDPQYQPFWNLEYWKEDQPVDGIDGKKVDWGARVCRLLQNSALTSRSIEAVYANGKCIFS